MSGTSFNFDEIPDRIGTGSIKWDRYGRRDVIPLWVADMDFPSPPEVLQALHRRVDHGVFGYTGAPESLVEAVREHLAAEFAWMIDPEWLVWLPGLVTGLNVACRAFGRDGDDVATFTPVYPPFLTAPGHFRRGRTTIPLARDGSQWEIDFDLLERAITPRTRLLLLCSPHNPVGRVWNRQELERLAEVAERFDLTVCSDEIHAGLILDHGVRHTCFASLSPETSRRSITLHAPSKTFNIPGLGCAFAVIADPGLRRSFKVAMAGIVPHVNALGFVAAEAAYRDGGEWRRQLLDYLRGNRDLVLEEIGAMAGLATTPVEATYLAWIDTRGLGIPDACRLFEDSGVGLSDGAEFGAPGYVRLNFGTSRTLLREGLRRMKVAIKYR